MPADLDNLYSGSCFIAGGNPCLLNKDLSILRQSGIMVMSINNTASVVPSDIWIGGDKSGCYSNKILRDPKIMKFAVISRKDCLVDSVEWKYLPNTYFFGTTNKFNTKNFLSSNRDLAWWKNTFFMAIQLAYRLGFRRVYLIGCKFGIDKDKQYSYSTGLTTGQITSNQRLYNQAIEKMKELKPHFEQSGFEVISSTQDSPLNEIYQFVPFNDAVKSVLRDFPDDYDTDKCVHSSFYKKGG